MTHSTKKRTATKRTKARKPAAKRTNQARRQTTKGRSTSQAHAAVNLIAAASFSTAAMLESPAKQLDFVLPGLLIGTVNLQVGPGGVGKSTFTLQNGLSVAAGCDLFNFWGDPESPFKMNAGKVVYISVEDGPDVVTERLKAAYEEFSPAHQEAIGKNMIFVFPPSFSIVKKCKGSLVKSDWILALEAFLKDMGESPRLIIIDTLNRSLGDANENSATSMSKIEKVLKSIAETHGCGVQLVHHTVKHTGTAEAGLKPDVARGSSAAVSNVRSMINLSPDDTNPNIVWYALSKVNYGPKPPTRYAIRNEDGIFFGSAHHPDKLPIAEPIASKSAPAQDVDQLVGKHSKKIATLVTPKARDELKSRARSRLN